MPHTREFILKHDNPYQLFATGEDLTQHQKILNALSSEEKKELAIKIISHCSSKELQKYYLEMQPIASHLSNDTTFYAILIKIHQIKSSIFAILDVNNKYPHQTFKDSMDLFNEYKDYALNLFRHSELNLAERMVISVPGKERASLAKQVSEIFPNSDLANHLSTMCSLRHQLSMLLSNQPETFFTEEFDAQRYLTCSLLVTHMLKDHEKNIGTKLAQTSGKLRSQIIRQLQLLTSSAHDSANPFTLIAKSMAPDKTSLRENHYRTFGKKETPQDPNNNTYTTSNKPHTTF
ncbi:MAG: hypothetical protein QM652_01545 [Legionella sp.]|uniref:hypothetical protein n=1 Tax=Legionella sp. TaxID=459 RepID=UPI0039E34AAE